VVFVETPIFTADVQALLSDEDYAALQRHLVSQPDEGDVIAAPAACERFDGRQRDGANVVARA